MDMDMERVHEATFEAAQRIGFGGAASATGGRRSIARLVAASVLLSPLTLGQGPTTTRVDPQVMVDLAAPGSTVVIPSGSYRELVLSKPLTIVGDQPRPVFASLELLGPGEGRLTLTNLALVGPSGGNAPVRGRGFTEVSVSDCDVTGFLQVAGARSLEVARTTLRQTGTAGPFITAKGATTVLLDVVIEPLVPPLQNPGADVITARLGLANTTIPGLVDAKRVQPYLNDLVLGGTPRPGGHLDLSWTTPAPSVVVYAASGLRHPVMRPDGIWFLEYDAQTIAVEVSPGGMSIPIPALAILSGQRMAFQVYDWVPPRALSRPVSTVLR
jgi:hypothetical protein